MLAEIPRKPIFPEHVLKRELASVERAVQNQVIPVSAGIYSEYKLNQKLQAIPKPVVVDYEDHIFYELADTARMPLNSEVCPLCKQNFGNANRKPVQCKFCGVWNCSNCICPRKRYHPRAKQSTSERYDICYGCDDKFLSLAINQGYVERKCLFEQMIKRVKSERDALGDAVDQRESGMNDLEETIKKNKFKISALKKERIDHEKKIRSLKWQKEEGLLKMESRQDFLRNLMVKKQRLDEQRQKNTQQQKYRQTAAEQASRSSEASPRKHVLSLSQNKVLEETIYQQKPTQNETIEQKQIQNQEISEQEANASAFLYPEPKPQKVNNFFNFHEWGREPEQSRHPQQEEKQEETNKYLDDQTFIDSNYPSPNNPQAEIELEPAPKESFIQKKLAEIFSKEDKHLNAEEELMETSSLDEETLNEKKREIVRAAIQRSQTERMLEVDQVSQVQPQKCACVIF